jgi:ribosomal protein S6
MSVVAQLRKHGLRFSAAGDALRVEPREALTDEVRAIIRAKKPDILRELAAETRERQEGIYDVTPLSAFQEAARQEVLARLAANPNVQRAFVNRIEDEGVVVTLAVRDVGTCELMMPAERFNPESLGDYWALVACIRCEGKA